MSLFRLARSVMAELAFRSHLYALRLVLGSSMRVRTERKGTSVRFEILARTPTGERFSRTVGPVPLDAWDAEVRASGLSSAHLAIRTVMDDMTEDHARGELHEPEATVYRLYSWLSGRASKIAAARVAALMSAFFLAGCICLGGADEPKVAPPVSSAPIVVPVGDLTEGQHHAWFQGGARGTSERQAARFLIAHEQRRDDAVCKAAIYCTDDVGIVRKDAGITLQVHVIAARNMLRDRTWGDIVDLVRRDAHIFGRDPDDVLSKLKGVLEQ